MITQSFDHIIPPMANASYYGSFTKALVELIVADVPFISLDSAATDTTATYDCTLAMSFDEATKIRFRNQSNAIYCSAIVNGTETSSQNTTSFYAQYSEIVKILVGTDVAVVLWSTNGNGLYSEYYFIFGRVSNVYDANYGTLIPFTTTGTSLMRVAAGNGTAYNLNLTEAYPTPLGVWGGAGTQWQAVPVAVRGGSTIYPYSGFVNGTDTFYRLYRNGQSFVSQQLQGSITIDGHEFFAFPYSTSKNGTYMVRLS